MTIIEAFTQNGIGVKVTSFTHLQKIEVVIKIHVNKWVKDAELRLAVRDIKGKAIFTSDKPLNQSNVDIGNQIIAVAEIPPHFLRPGSFSFTIGTLVHNQFAIDFLEDIIVVDIVDGGSRYAASEGLDYGYIFFDPKWNLSGISN